MAVRKKINRCQKMVINALNIIYNQDHSSHLFYKANEMNILKHGFLHRYTCFIRFMKDFLYNRQLYNIGIK